MDICKKDIFDKIKKVSDSTRFAVLATDNDGHPYTNLVGFFLSKNLKNLYFFTSKKTRKLKNILNNMNVCLLLDTRDQHKDKTFLVTAVTIIGKAAIIQDPARELLEQFLAKNTELKDFTKSDLNVLVEVRINKYILVNRFQEVIEMEVR